MVSHGERWRDSCLARGVTHLAIGSSDWLGPMRFKRSLAIFRFAHCRPNRKPSILDSTGLMVRRISKLRTPEPGPLAAKTTPS